MKSYLLCGIAVAGFLTIQSVPASAQPVLANGHPHVGHGHSGSWRGGYAHGYRPGYGIGAGAAAVATGALIGGAIATQNQGYYYPQNGGYYYPAQTYSGYSDPGYVYGDAAPAVYNNGDSVAYCEQTYRSYDPASGSYLGYDGYRHACP
jgi:hypothetical protein